MQPRPGGGSAGMAGSAWPFLWGTTQSVRRRKEAVSPSGPFQTHSQRDCWPMKSQQTLPESTIPLWVGNGLLLCHWEELWGTNTLIHLGLPLETVMEDVEKIKINMSVMNFKSITDEQSCLTREQSLTWLHAPSVVRKRLSGEAHKKQGRHWVTTLTASGDTGTSGVSSWTQFWAETDGPILCQIVPPAFEPICYFGLHNIPWPWLAQLQHMLGGEVLPF